MSDDFALPFRIKRIEPGDEKPSEAEQAEQERQIAEMQAQHLPATDRLQLFLDLPKVEKDFKDFWPDITEKGIAHIAANFARSTQGPTSATQAKLIAWWLCAAVREAHGPLSSVEAAWHIARKIFEREFGQVSDTLQELTTNEIDREVSLICPNCHQGRLIEDLYILPDAGATCDQCHKHYTAEQLDEWSV